MTSAPDEKWQRFNCFFSRVGVRTYQHPCIERSKSCFYVCSWSTVTQILSSQPTSLRSVSMLSLKFFDLASRYFPTTPSETYSPVLPDAWIRPPRIWFLRAKCYWDRFFLRQNSFSRDNNALNSILHLLTALCSLNNWLSAFLTHRNPSDSTFIVICVLINYELRFV